MSDYSSVPVTPAAAAQFAADMTARGLDGSAALAKFGYGADGQPAAQPTSPATQPTDVPQWSSAENEQAAQTLAQHWTGSPEVLHAALERAGLTHAEDHRTDVEVQFDDTLGAPASGDEYDLGSLMVNRDPDSTLGEQLEMTGAIRSALAELAVPKVLGGAVAGYLLDGVAAWDAVKDDPVSAARYHADQQALATKVLHTSWADVVETVRPLVQRLSASNRELLAPSGAFESAPLLIWLYRSSELSSVRAGLERSR